MTEREYDLERRLWARVLRAAPAGARRPALFLDRDGCLVEEVDYLRRAADVRLIEGAARIVTRANARAVPVVIVTNQAGIGRGILDWTAFRAVEAQIQADLAAAGAFVDAILACPDHPDGAAPYRHPDPPARKPNPGMLLRAAELLSLDLARSWIAGDRATDLQAGRNAGIEGGVHVLTGYGPKERAQALALADGMFAAAGAASIAELDALVPLLKD